MTPTTGYQALIVDYDRTHMPRLSQSLLSPDINGGMIAGVTVASTLAEAYPRSGQADFIFIDIFNFSVPEAVTFLREILSQTPVKSVALFRSNRAWYERQRDLDGLVLPADRLRQLPFVDKDTINESSFPNGLRKTLGDMARAFTEQLQRLGYTPDSWVRSGLHQVPPTFAQPAYPPVVAQPPVYPNYPPAPGQNMLEVYQAGVEMGRQVSTNTHPIGPLTPGSMEYIQFQQFQTRIQEQVAKLESQASKSEELGTKLNERTTSMQEQATGTLNQVRDLQSWRRSQEQIFQDLQQAQTKIRQQADGAVTAIRSLIIGLIATSAVAIVSLILAIAALVLHH